MKSQRWLLFFLSAMALLFTVFTNGVLAQKVTTEAIQALEWRNIGPFNGGRGTSVVGQRCGQSTGKEPLGNTD